MKIVVVCDNCLQITLKNIKTNTKYNFCCARCKNEWNSKKFSEFNKYENPMNSPGRNIDERINMRKRMLTHNQKLKKETKTYTKYLGEQEHRRIARLKTGRKLLPSEVVHHVDGNIHNNKPSNLIVMNKCEHSRLHMKQYWEQRHENK